MLVNLQYRYHGHRCTSDRSVLAPGKSNKKALYSCGKKINYLCDECNVCVINDCKPQYLFPDLTKSDN